MNPLRWRKMTWVLNIWNAIFAVWIIGGVNDRASKDCPPGDQLCVDASDVGTGIGVALIFVLWFLGFMVLALVWLMTRPRHRQCPVCGNDVKKGLTACRSCGHDFARGLAARPAAPSGLGVTASVAAQPPTVEPTARSKPATGSAGGQSLADRIRHATE